MISAPRAKQLWGRNCVVDLTRPCIMGVVNVTPDSFSDGGRFCDSAAAVSHALQLEAEGAQILDVGGESTRPGASAVTVDDELARVIPVIEGIRRQSRLPISVDTSKSQVAEAAIAAGANFINDISGGVFDPRILATAAASGAGLFLMHTRGTPEVMQHNTDYADLLSEVLSALQNRVEMALSAGVEKRRLAVDPGIGFGKSVLGNLELLHHLEQFHQLGYPLLVGTSRKSFIGRILGQDDPGERLYGTLATIAAGVERGAQMFRVHDVRAAREAALMAWSIREKRLL